MNKETESRVVLISHDLQALTALIKQKVHERPASFAIEVTSDNLEELADKVWQERWEIQAELFKAAMQVKQLADELCSSIGEIPEEVTECFEAVKELAVA
jgi:hypothetical protein